jgi:hypothetical protein
MGETERRRRRLRQSPRPSAAGTPGPAPVAAPGPAPGAASGPAPTPKTPHPHPKEPHATGPAAEPPAGPSASTAPVHDPTAEEEPPAHRPAARRGGNGPSDDREAERGLRGLIGSGASQVGTGAALRARDASRPTAEDEAEAEARLVVVRRNWVPREDLPRGR